MGLLSRHVSELKSEEFVLGVSTGFKGEAGSRFEGIESTKIVIVSTPASKNWTGYTAIEQAIADSAVGASMAGKLFPARCMVTYRRVAATEKQSAMRVRLDIFRLIRYIDGEYTPTPPSSIWPVFHAIPFPANRST